MYPEKDIRIFIKCNQCGDVKFTQHVPLLSLIASTEVACLGCGKPLNNANVLLCATGVGATCDTCEHRFLCFTSKPLEQEIDLYKGLDN